MRNAIFFLVCLGCGGSTTDGDDQPDAMSDAMDVIDAPTVTPDAVTTCDPIAQTGCTVSMACYLSNDGFSTQCLPTGTGAIGADCGPLIDNTKCAPGGTCYLSMGGTKTCHKFCTATPDCPQGEVCAIDLMHAPYGVCI